MSASHITPVEYQAFKTALKTAFANDDRFKDYDFEGSGLSSIIRLLSTVSSTQAVNNNLVLGESHISTSEILSNLSSLVTPANGYVPTGKRASAIVGDIVVTPADTDTKPTSISIDTNFSSIGIVNSASYNFSPDKTYTANLVDGKYTFENVRMIQGDWVTTSYNVLGSGILQYQIPNKNVDISTIQIFVRESSNSVTETEYSRFESGFQLGNDSTLFFLSKNRSGYYQIEFGDGAFSKAVSDGNVIYAVYLTTDGSAANSVASLTPTAEVEGFTDIAITPSSISKGGVDEETIEQIRKRAPINYGMDGVAVVTEEYGEKLKTLYPSLKITQWSGETNIPPKPGFVMLCTYPSLSSEEKTVANNYLKKYHIGSITTDIIDSQMYILKISIFVALNVIAGSQTTQAVRDITTSFNTLSENYIDFSSGFEPSEFATLIKDSVSSISRIYIAYTMQIPVVKAKRSISLRFHRQVVAGSVVVPVTGIPEIDTIKDSSTGVFKAYLNDVEVTELSSTNNYENGSFDITGLNVFSVSVEDGGYTIATASPGGDDQMVTSERNEVLTLQLETITPESSS